MIARQRLFISTCPYAFFFTFVACHVLLNVPVYFCSLRIFTFAAVIGVFILLPVNYMGDQPSLDFTGVQNKTLETFTISNVGDGSNR